MTSDPGRALSLYPAHRCRPLRCERKTHKKRGCMRKLCSSWFPGQHAQRKYVIPDAYPSESLCAVSVVLTTKKTRRDNKEVRQRTSIRTVSVTIEAGIQGEYHPTTLYAQQKNSGPQAIRAAPVIHRMIATTMDSARHNRASRPRELSDMPGKPNIGRHLKQICRIS